MSGQSLGAAITLGRRLILRVHGVIHAGVNIELVHPLLQLLDRIQGIRQGCRAIRQMTDVLLQTGQIAGDTLNLCFPRLDGGEDAGGVPGVAGIDLVVVRNALFLSGS